MEFVFTIIITRAIKTDKEKNYKNVSRMIKFKACNIFGIRSIDFQILENSES